MKKEEKKEIVKRHFYNLERTRKLEEEFFHRNPRERVLALEEWKDRLGKCS